MNERIVDMSVYKDYPSDEICIWNARIDGGRKVKITSVSRSSNQYKKQKRMFEISLRLPSTFFLKALEYYEKDDHSFFIYDDYDHDLDDFHGTLEDFKPILINMIKGLSFLHEHENMYHKRINKKYNLVIRDGIGYIGGVNWKLVGTKKTQSRMKQDAFSLLNSIQHISLDDLDFKLFVDFLHLKCKVWTIPWKHVLLHPFFMDHHKRLQFFFNVDMYFNKTINSFKQHSFMVLVAQELELHNLKLLDWRAHVHDPTMVKVLNHPLNNPYTCNLEDFVKFVRNCHAHVKVNENRITHLGRKNVIHVYEHFEELNQKLEKLYKGFLCVLYKRLSLSNILIFEN